MKTVEAWSSYQGSKQYDPKLVATFMGVSSARVVNEWRGDRLPIGDRLVRLRVLLGYLGYSVEEFDSLAEEIRFFAEALALNCLTVEKMADICVMPADSVLRLLNGRRGTVEERIQIIRQWQEENNLAKQLVEARKPWQEQCGCPSFPLLLQVSEEHKTTAVTVDEVDKGHRLFIVAAASNLHSMRYFISRLESDEFSLEERQEFRRQAGNDIMSVANQLFRLCSETARRQMKEE